MMNLIEAMIYKNTKDEKLKDVIFGNHLEYIAAKAVKKYMEEHKELLK